MDKKDELTVSREEIKEAVQATWNSNWHDSRTVEGETALMVGRLKELGVKIEEKPTVKSPGS